MSHNARLHCGPIQSKRRKEYYARMPAIVRANKIRKLKKHIKKQPNDLQAKEALGGR